MVSDTTNSWQRALTKDGSRTLLDPAGRVCHSWEGAWEQAVQRYAQGVQIDERGADTVRLLDVGVGLGLNMAAALAAVEGSAGRANRSLQVTGMELHQEPLRLAIAEPEPLAGPWHQAVAEALEQALELTQVDPERAALEGVPMGRGSRLWLCLGDARLALPALPPDRRFDAVFLDPFAPKEQSDLWGAEFLQGIAQRMDSGSRLATYCAASAMRADLLRAGLLVGRLGRVGRKAEGTVAAPAPADLPPLPPRALRRLRQRAVEPVSKLDTGEVD